MSNVLPLFDAAPKPKKPALSDAMLRRLQGNGAEQYFGDHVAPGLRLRVTAGGKKVWQFTYRSPDTGKPTKAKIGEYPSTSLSAARKAARALRAQVDAGNDPQAAKQAQKAERKRVEEHTFDKLVQIYETQHLPQLRPKSQSVYRIVLRRYLLPAWSTRPVDEITREDLHAVLDQLRANRPAMARTAYAVARVLFDMAVDRGWAPVNVAASVRRPQAPASRDRTLSNREIALLWRATKGMPTYGPAIRFLLATAQRRGEVGQLQWDQLDLERRVWTIPASASKNGRSHDVHLSDLALAQLQGVPGGSGSYVFASADKPLASWCNAKGTLDKRISALAREQGLSEPPAWRLHDIRRSAATRMAALGVDPVTIERVLNHAHGASSELMMTYQRYDRAAERRAALDALGDHLAQLVGEH
jgi:integrase